MKKILAAAVCCAALGGLLTARADSTIVTAVDGTVRDKHLVRMTFDGDNAVLTYHDDTQETVSLHQVTVTLTHGQSTAIGRIAADTTLYRGVYNLQGQRVALDGTEGLAPGLYIVNGQKTIVK